MRHPASRRRTLAVMLLVAPALAACNSDDPAPTGGTGPNCTQDVEITVTLTTPTTFTWLPACRVTALQVVGPSPDNHVMWYIEPTGAEGILPPVQYGIITEGASARIAAEPLTTGVSYRVAVARPFGSSTALSGFRSFTP